MFGLDLDPDSNYCPEFSEVYSTLYSFFVFSCSYVLNLSVTDLAPSQFEIMCLNLDIP
jgi:hypothetical protein